MGSDRAGEGERGAWVRSALEAGMASCHTCLRVSDAGLHVCGRCGASLHARKERSIERTVAYGLAGVLAFIPADVLPIMVGLIQLGNLMSIRPGGAAIAFGLMVVLTMLSAHSFDPRLIWDRIRETEKL